MKLEELARLAGVSKTTASIILNGRAAQYRISQATCDKVLRLAAKHHYIANAQTTGLQNSTRQLMALILPDLAHQGFAELSKHLECNARKAGFQLLISSTDDNPDTELQLIKTLIGHKVDAIISVACLTDYSIYQYAQAQGIPAVLLDRYEGSHGLDYIISDDKASAQALTTQWLKHCQGDLVYFGGPESMHNSLQRLTGFKEAVDLAHYSSGVAHIYHQDYSVAAGYQMMEAYCQNHQQPPHHLFTASFTLMEGALQFSRRHIAEYSKNWHWASFGDSYMLDLLPFPVHSARQEYPLMAEQVMSILAKKSGKQAYDGQAVLSRHIVERPTQLQ